MPASPSDNIDLIFRSCSDRTRLRILCLLQHQNELCVCDLIRILKLPQAKISRHLSYLRRAGLVACRQHKQWMHYRLLPPSSHFHSSILHCLATCLDQLPQLQLDRQQLFSPCPPCSPPTSPPITPSISNTCCSSPPPLTSPSTNTSHHSTIRHNKFSSTRRPKTA